MPSDALKPLIDRVQRMIDERRRPHSGAPKNDDLLQLLVDAKLEQKLDLDELDQAENHHAGLTKESLELDQQNLATSASKLNQLNSRMSDFEILSEAILLLGAGLETTRSSLSSITYFLAHNPQVQERLHSELKAIALSASTGSGQQVSFEYDSLTSCLYLDAVVSETLRIFPPALFTDRYTREEYLIEKYGIRVPKGVQLLFGIYAVHMDPDYWDRPEEFNPDRFMPGQKEKIVPGSYMPFSMGPRHCIGMRFSLTETKLALAKVLLNFKFEPAPGTKYPPTCGRTTGLAKIENCKARVTVREQ